MEVINYGVVLVNRDKETNFFPHHYPSSLEGMVDPAKYMNMACKVNSILVPEKRCFNFNTALYANYELIFCVFLLFLLVTISVIVYTTRNAPAAMVVATLAVTVLAIGLLSLKIHLTSKSGLGKLNETYLAVNKILQEWGDLYPRESVKFILSEQVDLILIAFPTSELEEEGSSDDNERGSRKFSYFSSNSKKNTSTKFYAGMLEVIEDENDS